MVDKDAKPANTPEAKPANTPEVSPKKAVKECYTFPDGGPGTQAYNAPFVDKCRGEYKGTIECHAAGPGKEECCCSYSQ